MRKTQKRVEYKKPGATKKAPEKKAVKAKKPAKSEPKIKIKPIVKAEKPSVARDLAILRERVNHLEDSHRQEDTDLSELSMENLEIFDQLNILEEKINEISNRMDQLVSQRNAALLDNATLRQQIKELRGEIYG